MNITSIAASSLRVRRPQTTQLVDACFIEVHATDSITGTAVAFVAPADVVQFANALLIGADPRATTFLWERMLAADVAPECRAALDIALWDLKAKAAGEPLWRMLGGGRTRLNMHIGESVPMVEANALASYVERMVRRHGVRAIELQAASALAHDAERLHMVHNHLRAVTHEPTLMLNARQGWSPDEAIQRVQALERDFDLTWIAAPTKLDDIEGLRIVSSDISAAVCAGSELDSARAYLPYLRQRALDIVQVDIARCGVTGSLQIADAAFGLERPVTFKASIGNIAAHVASAVPYCMSMEVTEPVWTGVVESAVRIVDGWAHVGDSVGHGLVVDAVADLGGDS